MIFGWKWITYLSVMYGSARIKYICKSCLNILLPLFCQFICASRFKYFSFGSIHQGLHSIWHSMFKMWHAFILYIFVVPILLSKALTKNLSKMLDASVNIWAAHFFKNWGITVDNLRQKLMLFLCLFQIVFDWKKLEPSIQYLYFQRSSLN